jgi:hypothetical protein
MAVVDPKMRQRRHAGILACSRPLQPAGNSADVTQVKHRRDLHLLVWATFHSALGQRLHKLAGRPNANRELSFHVAQELRDFLFVIDHGDSFAWKVACCGS